MNKTFKSSNFCNISYFYNGSVWDRSKVQRFKGHFLNELHLSFKYHPNYLSSYLLKFKQFESINNLNQLIQISWINCEYKLNQSWMTSMILQYKNIDRMFRDILKHIYLQHQAIHVSIVSDLLNEKFHAENTDMFTSSET